MLRMVLRIDPRVPLVWRDPTSMQFGVDEPRVILRDLDPTTERMIAALTAGVSPSGLAMIGGAKAGALLDQLAAVLESATPSVARVVIVGRSTVADRLAAVLTTEHCTVERVRDAAAAEDRDADLGIAVGEFVLDPQLHGLWLRRDVPHLPAIVGDLRVSIGPLVEPGSSPCLHCVHLWRRDTDAAWPAIAAQVWGRTAAIGELAATEAAAAIARLAVGRLRNGPGTAQRHLIELATGARSVEAVAVHPECECSDDLGGAAELSRAGRRESGLVAVQNRRLVDAPPTKDTAASAPA
jgi:bacteriocin biosynthesis cyclodehydratase domain-containing protein